MRVSLFVIIFVNSFSLFAQGESDETLVKRALEIIYNQDQSDHDKALDLLNNAIRINPKNAEAYCYRALLKNLSGNNAEALVDYDQAISLNKDLAIAYKGRGIAKDNMKDYVNAIKDYDIAIKLQPDMVVYHYRGCAKMLVGQNQSACEDFKKSCELGFSYGCSDLQKNCK